MQTETSKLTDVQVIGRGPWPAWFTVAQMRSQLEHEGAGCPPPFPGAVWDGYCYARGPK